MNSNSYCSRRGQFRLLFIFITTVGFFTVFSTLKKYMLIERSLYNTLLSTYRWKYNKTHCQIPEWREQIRSQPWYPLYISHLKKVDLSNSSEARSEINCARWWHPTPQRTYDELPDRGVGWKPNKKPPNYKRPMCEFGQKKISNWTCGTAMQPLWEKLDELDIVYYPRDGSELGVVRTFGYISSDGDMDIFVDMPQEMLYKALVNVLKPRPYLSGKGVTRGVHWDIPACPIVHIHFSDWAGVERGKQATHNDLCTCMLNSVPMACHKEAVARMFTEYGPSWRVPLHTKHLDCVVDTYKFNTKEKLEKMVSKSGLIEEKNVRALDRSVQYSAEEMLLILAHLNIVKATIDSGKRYSGVNC